MFRKLQNRLALLCGISALVWTGCSSEDAPEMPAEPVMVTVQTKVPRSIVETSDTLHSDLDIKKGYILIYDENGNYEAGDRLDLDGKVSLVVSSGKKHIVTVANPPKALNDLIANDLATPDTLRDEQQIPQTFMGNPILVNITPVQEKYEDLIESLSLAKDYVKNVTDTHRMLMVADQESEVINEDNYKATIIVPLTVPMARVDLHARCLANEKVRVADAAIRVEHVSPYLNWGQGLDLTRPATEDQVLAEYKNVSDRMTAVTDDDDLFSDWKNTEVQEDAPLATLYTYYTDANVRLYVGLRFEGSADYDWYPIDMEELMKPSWFRGLESGHLYQIFITVYPDKVGHIIVDPWVNPDKLEFTIG